MKNKKVSEKILIFALITIPIFTILFAIEKSPFNYTLSMIGNWFGLEERIEFIVWGIFTAFMLAFFLKNIYIETRFNDGKANYMLYLSSLFLILAVFVPTVNREPIPKELRPFLYFNLHVLFVVLFAVFLTISLYMFTKYLSKKTKNGSVSPVKYLMFTSGISILLLTIFGMTGIFEISFFTSLSIFLIILERRSKKIAER